jgi:lysozyme family protein
MNYSENKDFMKWYEIVSGIEGGISDRPLKEDAGGLTNRGITYKTYLSEKLYNLVGKTSSESDFRNLTNDETKEIAYKGFWLRYGADALNNVFKKVMYMDSIWSGGGLRSLGFKTKNEFNNTKLTNKQVTERRWNYFKKVPSFPYNKNGWLNRLNLILRLTSQDFRGSITKNDSTIIFNAFASFVVLIFFVILYKIN